MADSEVRQKELMTLELKAMIRKIETFRTSLPDKLRIMQRFYDAVFEAGMRAGEIAMKEKAAKTMESLSANWVNSLPMDEVQSLNCRQYARAIRALPLSGAEESKKED